MNNSLNNKILSKVHTLCVAWIQHILLSIRSVLKNLKKCCNLEAKKKCLNCGKQLSENFKFCPYCGYRQDNSESKILYHYTTVETAFKILSNIDNKGNLTLHAGLYNSMNDPNDCRYLINELKEIYSDKAIDERSMLDEGVPYFVSFSLLGDDLHMWNCYGEDGKGIAFGLDKSMLGEIDYRNRNGSPEYVNLYRCHYLKDNSIIDFFNEYGLKVENLSGRGKWHFSYIIKHPCYQYEQEERLLIPSIKASNEIVEDKKIEPFLEVKIPIKALKEIIIGPAQKQVPECFRSFKSIDQSIIKLSNIPYKTKDS